MLVVPSWREKYTSYFYTFMDQIYNNVALNNRIKELETFLLPLATRDQYTRVLTGGQPVATVFQAEVAYIVNWIADRNAYIVANLEPQGKQKY